ncbi:hypothetical protein Sjap_023261 [Stephania japonica]|uniref:Uncharacterized protein n=1 Tax=Stephania japonica TaxID=461633 RepID=A0AAP0EJQ4_9MAGN
MAEQETDVAQNDLEIIGNESEKVARAGQKDRNDKPALCDSLKMNNIDEAKQVIGTDTNQNVMDSPIHSLKTTEAKKNRTSLYELMQCDMEEDATRKHETKENMETIKKETTVKQFVNILKQRVLSATLSKASNDASTTNFVSSKKKLHKILRIFDKKVHPENSRVIRKSKTFDKYETESKIPCYGGYHNKYQILPVRDGDIMTLPHKVIVNEHVWHYKNNLDPPSFAPRGSISNKKKGCWIKTDAEYLVLEL